MTSNRLMPLSTSFQATPTMPLPEAENAPPANQEQEQQIEDAAPEVIDVEGNSDTDEEEMIQLLMEDYEEPPRAPCVSDRHPHPSRNRLPDERTVDAHDWLNGQTQAYEHELTDIRRIVAAQVTARQALAAEKGHWQVGECLPQCQHQKAHQETKLLDLAIAASDKMERACQLYKEALHDFKHYLCIRTYQQNKYKTPLLYGPIPVPDTGMSLPITLSDPSTDSNGASSDDATE